MRLSLPPLAAARDRLLDRGRPGVLWALLIMLVLIGQAALWRLTWQHENTRSQDATEAAAGAAAEELRQRIVEDVQVLQQLTWGAVPGEDWVAQAEALLREHREVMRVELRDAALGLRSLAESGYYGLQYSVVPREQMILDAEVACTSARRFASPSFSRSYFMPMSEGQGMEVVDLCLPRTYDARNTGYVIATFALGALLSRSVPGTIARSHEISFVESDGTRLARHGSRRGSNVYMAERLIDVHGLTLPLRLNSVAHAPHLIPNLSTALVLALSLGLSLVLLMLVHDVRRRGAAETRLAEALAFRQAMEDALPTGLRAGDGKDRLTYANQAFCKMVDYSIEELRAADTPPYWPQDALEDYRRRQAEHRASQSAPREGFETTLVRRNGERFPVMIFEAPLVDARGQVGGWMSSVLDLTAQRRAEDLLRRQQDKLQATARLATMGEMATLLSHELNQPLAAIASYAAGSINLLPADAAQPVADAPTQHMLHQAMIRIAEQADRAGRVIRSVQQFARRRERLRENVRADELLEAVLPLVRLSARRFQARVEVDLPTPVPRVSCDRTMVEQVLLNLARNGLQAMEGALDEDPPVEPVLVLRVRALDARWVELGVCDRGPGIPEAVARQLFVPFFSTKPEGMGLGLAMCRTVVEQHGGAMAFAAAGPGERGSTFRFTLPAAQAAPAGGAPPAAPPGHAPAGPPDGRTPEGSVRRPSSERAPPAPSPAPVADATAGTLLSQAP